jgi:hypothetical protein
LKWKATNLIFTFLYRRNRFLDGFISGRSTGGYFIILFKFLLLINVFILLVENLFPFLLRIFNKFPWETSFIKLRMSMALVLVKEKFFSIWMAIL